jgi:hypothetical protein
MLRAVRNWVLAAVVAGAVVGAGALARDLFGPHRDPGPPAGVDPQYEASIKPLFDHRCVPCHACFDSPCQLNLQSFEGLDRGASKELVYQADRPRAMHPTRMFQDAHSTAEWQTHFDFFPVVTRKYPGDLAQSLVWRFVEGRKAHPGGGPFDVDTATDCPSGLLELEHLLHDKPDVAMPYGFPPLTDAELATIADWLRNGSGGPAGTPASTAEEAANVLAWETFLNGSDAKTRLTARYLFEHLFFAHLQLGALPGTWFRLVRSKTASGEPIQEIATVRPYDDPHATTFFYRLERIEETIVEKTHVPYLFNAAKLARVKHLFLDADWAGASQAFPSYAADVAANPFEAFAAIPAAARYQFMLDDALYHVKTFIHGPVCKGQVALDVIDEHFLIFFLAPGSDPAVTDPAYLQSAAEDLAVPAEGGDGIEAVYGRFKLDELAYLKMQGTRLESAPGRSLADLWNGDGTNPDAVLTVYRHFDSAFVLAGAVGGVPKTAWVLDYPIFERMYYDLVAGFDVFGNIVHQTSTRRYMNLLRIEAEDQFLRFVPVAQREAIRAFWYRGAGISTLVDVVDPLYGGPEPQIAYTDPSHAKEEFVRRVLTSALPAQVVGPREPIQWTDVPIDGTGAGAAFELGARDVTAKPGPFVLPFPDAALLRIHPASAANSGEDLVYTVVRNRAHENIDFMFLEKEYLLPQEDTLHVVRGIVVSRPNLLLKVNETDLPQFFAAWKRLDAGGATWKAFLDRYGVRRSDPAFWGEFDRFEDAFPRLDKTVAGVLDLSRYIND